MKYGMRPPPSPALVQGPHHGQVEEAGEESPHTRIREEGHGLGQEPKEGRLQQSAAQNGLARKCG